MTKFALGRSMMRAAPVLLVLDEPTAALQASTSRINQIEEAQRQQSELPSHGAENVR